MQAIESREPNVTSLQHILAELERIDLLVHVHVMRAREADDTDGRVKGLYISEQEVDGLLSRPAGLPRWAVASEASETSVGVTLDRLAAEVERLEAESARTGETLRLVALARKFKLDPFDLDALLVCLAPELDLRYERLYAYLQDDVTRKRPSVDLVLNVLCRAFEEKVSARQRFGPQAPLLKHRLVEMVDDPSQQQPTLLSKHLRVDERVAGYLLDSDEIDQRGVVSKYIGETEKNLSRIFAEAETSNAILFFDEADALFGKRSEVRDAHDRYANIEISYLLQRMEEYEGVVVLATNLRKNMDDAFVRRMHSTVEFPFPSQKDRRRIWDQIWPDSTPRTPDLDLDFMARRFELAGGNIRNIAPTAAFLAADDGGVVTMAHLLRATQREYQKMGKVVAEGEFVSNG